MEKVMHTVYLSLGTNLGERMDNLTRVVGLLTNSVGHITAISPVYESKSWGYDSQNDYLNCCVCVETTFSPTGLLAETNRIEELMGRKKTADYTDRIIDIDILFYDDLIQNENHLIIPHPHIEKRDFVLFPLADIAPNLFHPTHFLTIKQLLDSYPDSKNISYYQSFEQDTIINS